MQQHSRHMIDILLGRHGIVKVDPSRVEYKHSSSRLEEAVFEEALPDFLARSVLMRSGRRVHPIFRRFVIAKEFSSTPVSEWNKFTRLQDYYTNLDAPMQSIWHEDIMASIDKKGFYKHKTFKLHNRSEVEAFFNGYITPLFQTMRESGYDPSKTHDMGTAFINDEGIIVKGSGADHRFCVARLVGATSVPLRIIGVSHQWFAREVGPKMNLTGLRAGIRKSESIAHAST